MPDIYDLANKFKRAQLRNERAAASEMVRVYGGIWREISRQITELTKAYYAASEPKASWLYQFQRLQTLRSQVESQLTQFAQYADTTIQAQQWQALQAGKEHAGQLLQAAMGGKPWSFNVLPTNAIDFMVGFQQDGSPLLSVLQRYGKEAAEAMANRLVQGLALGQGPAAVARLIRKDMGMALWEALRLARTETLRAYRASSSATYRENSDVVEGWVWLSARNTRTCACCWAMDGTFHELDEELDDHPNGRCTKVPKIKGMNLPMRQTGVQAFEKLSDVDKLKVLGPSKYAAYRAGDLKLPQLIGVKHDKQWGRMFYERSLKDVLGPEEALKFNRLALSGAVKVVGKENIDDLIKIAGLNIRNFTEGELSKIVSEVATAGFDPKALEVVRGRLAGMTWGDKVLRGSDRLSPAEVHYLWHAVKRKEWPAGTTIEGYIDSLRKVIRDPNTGIFVSKFSDVWQLGFVGRSGELRGIGGKEFVIIEYRTGYGHWTTGYQPVSIDDVMSDLRRTEISWLRATK